MANSSGFVLLAPAVLTLLCPTQVHQTCLQRWVDEKQQGNAMAPVRCPQCNTEYIILFPQMGESDRDHTDPTDD